MTAHTCRYCGGEASLVGVQKFPNGTAHTLIHCESPACSYYHSAQAVAPRQLDAEEAAQVQRLLRAAGR